ncbi:MAG TPA: hypothetical protein PLV06_05200 [Bacteroidales bacterium]|nr:hypothetical protein [Bacteroidales bacterium]HPR11760.1 hypothetical protein [Bacteroidales bacterium]
MIMSILFMFTSADSVGQSLTYKEFLYTINRLEEKSDFESALGFLKDNKHNFPFKDFELSKEEIYINEKLLRYSDNLKIFREGHQKGFFYFLDGRIPKYKPYMEFSEFISISEHDLKLRDEAMRESKIIYEAELPERFSGNRKWPLCLIFHGGGSNLERVKEHWHSQELDSNYIKIYFQSYRHYDYNTYGWTSGDERANRELEKCFETIKDTYPIDCSNILSAGISAGGTFAIDIAVRGVIPVTAFISFCPGIPRILANENMPVIISSKINGVIVGGEKDFYLPQQRQMIGAFRRLQNPVKHIIISDMEHEYPPNEGKMIDEAIEFITKKE